MSQGLSRYFEQDDGRSADNVPAFDKCAIMEDLPTLYAFLTDTSDGERERLPSRLTLQGKFGKVSLTLTEPSRGLVCFWDGPNVLEALTSLEEALRARQIRWRQDQYAAERRDRTRSSPPI